jgi:thymidylate synthase
MKYVRIQAFDCPDAWYKALVEIWNNGDPFEVKYGSECCATKKLNLSIEISHPENRPLVGEKAPCDMKYVQWYALRYLWSGEIEDEHYTYGSRLRKPVDQIEELIGRYLEEQNDRQVTLVIRLPEDIKKQFRNMKQEFPCLSLIDSEIYGGRLHLTCYFRSWDAYAGLPANIAGIQPVNEAVVSEINKRGSLNLQTGKLIFHSKNCHVYERQFKMVEDLLKGEQKNDLARLDKRLKVKEPPTPS